jgi:hypothetical protein
MVGGAGRQTVIEAQLDLRRSLPLQGEQRERLARQRIDHRIVPQQELDGEARPGAHQRAQEFAEHFRQLIPGLAGLADEARLAVDVPADDVDRALGIAQGAPQGPEIARAIDEHRDAIRPFDAPGVAAGAQHGPLLRPRFESRHGDPIGPEQ